jgi:hypothetical protein
MLEIEVPCVRIVSSFNIPAFRDVRSIKKIRIAVSDLHGKKFFSCYLIFAKPFRLDPESETSG